MTIVLAFAMALVWAFCTLYPGILTLVGDDSEDLALLETRTLLSTLVSATLQLPAECDGLLSV